MQQVKAYAARDPKSPLAPHTISRREPGPNDVQIDIKFCGICHSDLHQARDEWGGSIYPMVPGHEIAGVVSRVGAQVTKFRAGDKVGIGCFVDSCRDCSSCREGLDQYCERGMVATYNGYEKDGKTLTYGGYSTHIVADQNYVLRIPENLPLDQAAPLLCAGITTYSPLRHWNAGPGKRVAVVGLGGLGHMAVKIAAAMGAEVNVLSQSTKKREDSLRMGAKGHYATSQAETFEKFGNYFDLIINTVSVDLDWNKYLNLLRRDGTMVLLGVPPKAPPVHAFSLIMKRRSLAGSLIGGIKETQEMLDFCGKHGLTSDIEVIPAQKINEAYERMLKGDVRYRFVIDTQSLNQ
ncbi:MAG TPA: NAD(P)-dependent alcohol dehydrogenase [Bdellovibrionales bacterium]|nr:NAD(P)-dependent alcohol dehydrogenase [Bdellovibrionales bacterium]